MTRSIALPFVTLVIAALATTAVAQSWRTIRPEGEGFVARFPGEPQARTRTERDDYGQWTNRSWRAMSGHEAFQVTIKDYSAYDVSGVPIDQVLALMCRVSVGSRDAEVQPLSSDVPARRCRGDRGSEARVYWSAPKLYTAVFLCDRGDCGAAGRNRFFEGFRLR